MWFVRNTRPEVFCQKLVQLPPVLSQMTSVISGASTAASISGSSAQPRQALGSLLAENRQSSGSRPEAWLPAIVRDGRGGAFQ